MKTIIASATLASLLAACSPAPPAVDQSVPAAEAPNAATAAIEGVGVVTAVDPAAGTISLDHEAITAINWPAMTMQFRADDPSILQGLAVGDRVRFELKSARESTIVTAVRKQ
ncbi:MAG: copper-binding protein [Hyphomonadaceae bacterium]|nr:copper-binding protein [Hyphomonadaceae bacterium]